MMDISKFKRTKIRHDITYPESSLSFDLVPQSEELQILISPAKDEENYGEHLESESEEYYVGHNVEE